MTQTRTQTKGKTFAELYKEEKAKPTAAQQFITKVADYLNRDEGTVRLWLCGACTPSKDIKDKIEEYFNADIKTLFPNYNK